VVGTASLLALVTWAKKCLELTLRRRWHKSGRRRNAVCSGKSGYDATDQEIWIMIDATNKRVVNVL